MSHLHATKNKPRSVSALAKLARQVHVELVPSQPPFALPTPPPPPRGFFICSRRGAAPIQKRADGAAAGLAAFGAAHGLRLDAGQAPGRTGTSIWTPLSLSELWTSLDLLGDQPRPS